MEQFLKEPKIVSQQNFAKSNDLPIFVKLMIQKDRKNFLTKKILEAKRLMGIADGIVLMKKLTAFESTSNNFLGGKLNELSGILLKTTLSPI